MLVAIDTETSGKDWVNDYAFGFAIAKEGQDTYYLDTRTTNREDIRKHFLELWAEDHDIVMQNAKFDLHMLRELFDLPVPKKIHDTVSISKLLNPRDPANLERLTRVYLNKEPLMKVKEYLKSIKSKCYLDCPIDMMEEHCSSHATNTLAIYKILAPLLKTEKLTEAYQLEMDLLPHVVEMERVGILVDVEYLLELKKGYVTDLKNLEEEIFAVKEIDIMSPVQVGKLLFDELKIKPLAYTSKKKQPKCDEEILSKLEHPIAKKIVEYRSLNHTLATYIDGILQRCDANNRVHTQLNPNGARTGRFSSENPNMQNIPAVRTTGDIRKAFIGNRNLYAPDYSQMEMRVFAVYANEEVMLEAFRNDDDVYAAAASDIFKIGLSHTEEKMKKGDVTYRDFTKGIILGIIYGMGAKKFGVMTGGTTEDGKAWLRKFYKQFPGVKPFKDNAEKMARGAGYVRTISGRKCVLYPSESYKAVNAICQGSAADAIKIGMIEAGKYLENKKGNMLLQVHDELLFEDLTVDDVRNVNEILENVMGWPIPLQVEGKVGKNWAEMQKI